MKAESFRDLVLWQKSIDLTDAIYDLTELLPKEEIYGLTSQMRRAAVSIASNIAEGYQRPTRKDYVHILHISLGSIAELETQVVIANRRYGPLATEKVDGLITQVGSLLNVFIEKLSAQVAD